MLTWSDGDALARFDRDVLAQPAVTHVIVMEGINDIGQARERASPSAADLIAGHRQLIERAHARGLKIYGATLTPFEGANYWTPEGEAKRQALNQWIRTSQMYDAVIDFDAVVRDPNHPTKFHSTIRETTCIPTPPGTRRWRMRSTWDCSKRLQFPREGRVVSASAGGPYPRPS